MRELDQIEKELDEKINSLNERILAGEVVMLQCKKQLHSLKMKIKEYKRIKEQIVIKSAADGDL